MSEYKNLSDPDLISLIKDGNHTAYTEIFTKYYYPVLVQAYKKLRDENQAKDIVQELFTELWFKREQTPVVNNLAGYLITAVRNRILNFYEHQKVESKHIESLKNYVNIGSIAHTDYLVREKEQKAYIDKAICHQDLQKFLLFVPVYHLV